MDELIWHPASQMKDYIEFPPLDITKAEGSYLTLQNGHRIIDAISSWWCKPLGHAHPALMEKLRQQTHILDHVILANTINPEIQKLSTRLSKLISGKAKVFYACDGSSAVEIAMKLALRTQQLRGQVQKTQFACLQDGYHGETLFTLAMSDADKSKADYLHLIPEPQVIRELPRVLTTEEPLFQNCESHWDNIERQLLPKANQLAAILVEPIVQGVGGMQIYSADLLRRLKQFCETHEIFLIADEIMTGFGRTGLSLAIDHAGITPDLVCLGKGLTGGVLPMSAVLISDDIYQEYYCDYGKGRDFLHSHTQSGNIFAASVANACLDVLEQENIYQQVQNNSQYLHTKMLKVANDTGKLTNVRSIGAIAAADLTLDMPRAGYQVYQQAVQLGALLRPLGNTLYWLLPLNATRTTMDELADITTQAIRECNK